MGGRRRKRRRLPVDSDSIHKCVPSFILMIIKCLLSTSIFLDQSPKREAISHSGQMRLSIQM